MKYIKKLPPAFFFDFYAHEVWLEDLAEEGLFLVSLRGQRAKFRQDTPKKMKYRIEIPKYFDTAPPKALREERQQQGWTFIAPYYLHGFLWCSAEENAKEFIDAETQTENIHVLYKSIRNFYLVGMVLLLFLLLLTMKRIFHYQTPPFSSFDRFLFVWELLIMFWGGGSLYLCKATKKELFTADFTTHRRDYHKGLKWQKINFLFYPVFILTWILFCFLSCLPF